MIGFSSVVASLAVVVAQPGGVVATSPILHSASAPIAVVPIAKPIWTSTPNEQLMITCTQGYLSPNAKFTRATIMMACMVGETGALSDCRVKENAEEKAAGLHDVAICTAPAFRMTAQDGDGKPTAGRPVAIPMAITTLVEAKPEPAGTAARKP